jgi:hypothetical protein
VGAKLLLLKSLGALATRNLCLDSECRLLVMCFELFSEPSQGDSSIPKLASLISGNCRDPGSAMREADPGFSDILVLSASPSRAKGFDPALGEEVCVGSCRGRALVLVWVSHGAVPVGASEGRGGASSVRSRYLQ